MIKMNENECEFESFDNLKSNEQMAINQLFIHLSYSILHSSTYYELIEHEQSVSIPNQYGNEEGEFHSLEIVSLS